MCERFSSYEDEDNGDATFSFPVDTLDSPIQACFEDGTPMPMELSEVYELMKKKESLLSVAPIQIIERISTETLETLKVKMPMTDFALEKNHAIELIQSDENKDSLQSFIKLIWMHSFIFTENHIMENPD